MSRNLRKIFKEAGFTVAGSFLKSGIGFVMTAIIARFLSQELYGTFTQAFTVVTILMIFASLGIPQAYTKYIPEYLERGKQHMIPQLIRLGFLSSTAASIILVAVTFIAAPAIANVFGDEEVTVVLRSLLPLLPVLIWIRNMLYIFVAYKELRYSVYIHRLILPTAKIIIISTLFYFSFQISALIIAELVATAVAFIALLIWYRQRLDIPEKSSSITPGLGKEILSYALPLMLSQVMLLALSYADIIMLGLYLESDQVGIYKVVLNGAYLIMLAYMSLALIYKPVISGLLARNNITEVKSIYQKLNRWGIFFNTFLILVIALFGKDAIRLAFTDAYTVGYTTMIILAAGYVLTSSFGHALETIEAVGRTRIILFASLSVSGLNIALNAILIPLYGLEGGAIATAISATVVSAIYAVALFKMKSISPFTGRVLSGIAAGGVLYIVFSSLDSLEWGLSWLTFIGAVSLLAVLYAALLLLFKGFEEDDKAFFINAMKKRIGI